MENFKDIRQKRQARLNSLLKQSARSVSDSLDHGVHNLQEADVAIATAIALLRAWGTASDDIDKLEQARQVAKNAQEIIINVKENE